MSLNSNNNLIALIPARSGSKRLKHKNIIKISEHPLIAYSINSAKKSKLFHKIYVLTDSIKYAKIAKYYGAEVPFLRKKKDSGFKSPDFIWLQSLKKFLIKNKISHSHFFILRPTNPFRTSNTIKRAWKEFKKSKNAESLRAVETVNQHPGKMWVLKNNYIKPFMIGKINRQPFFNSQLSSLPKIFVQNASLEISNFDVVHKYKTITGKKIVPFFTKNYEGFDVNNLEDMKYLKFLIYYKNEKLQKILKKPYKYE